MENTINKLEEKIKNFDFDSLIKKNTYIDFCYKDEWYPAFIKNTNDDSIFDINISIGSNKISCQNNLKKNTDSMNFFRYNLYNIDNFERYNILNEQINDTLYENILENLEIYEQKIINNKEFSPYEIIQFFSGEFIDIVNRFSNEPKKKISSFEQLTVKDIRKKLLYLYDFVTQKTIDNIDKLKILSINQQNRKYMLIDYDLAIIGSFDILFKNNLKDNIDDNNENYIQSFKTIANNSYEILINCLSNQKFFCPLYYFDIIISSYNNLFVQNIKGFDLNQIISAYIMNLENLSEQELKNIKQKNYIENLNKRFSSFISINNARKDNLYEQLNYLFYYRCITSQILEKKIYALNAINDHLSLRVNSFSFNKNFYEILIVEKNILSILLEDSVHDEILKRVFGIIHYLAKFNKIPDKIISLLIENKNKILIQNILSDIVSELQIEKRNQIFNDCTKDIDLSINDNIEFIKNLTEGCFNLNRNRTKKINIYIKSKYGLDILYDYIINYSKKKSKEDNINYAIDSFVQILSNNTIIKDSIILEFFDLIFEQIVSDEKNENTVQCIILIINIFNECYNRRNSKESDLKKLDSKYNIIQLFVESLEHYVLLIKKILKKNKIEDDKIYNGNYSYSVNIKKRLEIIFFFLSDKNFTNPLDLLPEEHLGKMFNILSSDQKNLKELYYYLIRYFDDYPDRKVLLYFINQIVNNKNYININNIIDEKEIDLIIKVFHQINLDNSLILYKKTFKVKNAKLEKIELIYDILLNNDNPTFQNKCCMELTNLCLNLCDYSSKFSENYWKTYINEIITILKKCIDEKNLNGINGIIHLLGLIYSKITSFQGKIPSKSDTESAKGETYLFQFHCAIKNHQNYKVKVGKNENLIDLRWRIGYYYDINVNEVIFENIDGKKYNLLYDFYKFINLFPPDKYIFNNYYNKIIVKQESNQLLMLKVNPKKLIENNEELIKIFLDLISQPNDDKVNNIRVWNILQKMPKDYYINKKINKLFSNDNIDSKDIKDIFNLNNIYILTYSLDCMRNYIEDNKKKEKDLLNNFINVHNGGKKLYNLFKKIKVSELKKKYDSQIVFECLNFILTILNKISFVIEKDKEIDNNLIENLLLIILDIMKISRKNENENEKYIKFNIIILKNFIIEKLPNLKKDEKIDLEEINDKVLFTNQNEFNSYLIFLKEKKYSIHGEIFEKILNYLNNLYDNETGFLEYILTIPKIFNEIIIYQYIQSENVRLQKIIYKFLYESLFEDNSKLFFNFLDLIFEKDNIEYINKNDKSGIYLELLSNLINKFTNLNSDNIPEYKNKNKLLNVINLLLSSFKNKKDNSEINEEEIEGKANLLKNLVELFPKDIIPYLLKENLYSIFFEKFIFSKCNENSVSNPKTCLKQNDSKKSIYNLIISIIKQNPNETLNLYLEILGKLNNIHLLGFWKSNYLKNWVIDLSKDIKTEYCGLKNMSCTCYMNSILQQFFNIPILRETILSIKSNETSILYNLQIVFSSLKAYESQYYNPKDFALINNLILNEQMDADEFYGRLIDSIEKDINNIYNNSDENIKNPYKSLFNYFFGGKFVDELKFECGHKRYNEFQYNSIQINIQGCNNIYEALNNYIKSEVMDGENKINCEECKTKIACNKRQIFKNLPNILVIVLKRFEFDYDNMIKYKLNDYFEFPMTLNMKNYLIEDSKDKNCNFELNGIVIHLGTSESGHYYDLIKTSDNKWYEFNDITVKEFDEKNIPNEAFGFRETEEENYKDNKTTDVDNANNAYILFYKKIEKNKNKEFETKLASPPYNNLSNINNKILNNINIEMYEYWILKNITSKEYQLFVLELVKIDIAKYMKDFKPIENKKFYEIFDKYTKERKEEIFIENATTNYQIFENDNKEIIFESKDNSEKIFKFMLLFYFSLCLRIKDKSLFLKFTDIIKIYITVNINYAKYIIEEFSDNDTINEFLILCPGKIQKKIVNKIISYCLFKINNDEKGKEENDIILLFMNSIISIINLYINEIDIKFIYLILFEILCLNEKYGKKLLEIEYDKYINNYFGNNQQLKEEMLYNDKDINKLKSTHHILSDKIIKNEYLPKEKLTYSEENYEKKQKKALSEERNDQFFNSCYLLLMGLKKKKK